MVEESDLYLLIFIPIVLLVFFAVAIWIAIASKKDSSEISRQSQQQFIFVQPQQQQRLQQPPVYSLAVDMPNYSLIRISRADKEPDMDLPPSYEYAMGIQQDSDVKSTVPL